MNRFKTSFHEFTISLDDSSNNQRANATLRECRSEREGIRPPVKPTPRQTSTRKRRIAATSDVTTLSNRSERG